MSFEIIYPENANITGVGEIVSIKEEKDYYDRYIVKIKNIENMSKNKNTKLIIYVKKGNDFEIGDIVKFEGEFSKGNVSRNYKGFNYRNYLKQSKIYGIVMIKSIEKVDNNITFSNIIGNIKQKLYERLEILYENEYADFLNGMLLGDINNLDDEIKENFRDSNILHILAISGTHTTYVIFGVKIILEKFIQSKNLKNIIIIFILIFFAIITGLSASCLIACIMSGMVILSNSTHRKSNFYRSMFITFIIMIIHNPYNLIDVGMWLSIAGSIGIVTFHRFLKRVIECRFKVDNSKYKIRDKIIDICLLSISAQILIIPIITFVFNTISFTFFISNLLIHYLVGPILAIGYISLFVGMISLNLGKILAVFETILIKIILLVAKICSKIPLSKIYVPTPNFIVILLYYISIVFFIYYFNTYKFKILRVILDEKHLSFYLKEIIVHNKDKIKKAIAIILCIILILNLLNFIPEQLKIYFVDVRPR